MVQKYGKKTASSPKTGAIKQRKAGGSFPGAARGFFLNFAADMQTAAAMESYVATSLTELSSVAEALLAYAGPRRLMVFTGEVGAGKTTLIQALCRCLGMQGDQAVSPTFALINEYAYQNRSGAGRIAHIDLYRLTSLEEALSIGIEDYLYGEDYCFIEWPELIEPLLPAEAVRINLEITGSNSRKILFL
jgi:tRNA threonylcarbamoyladenosine biosynthesis protein TsaE